MKKPGFLTATVKPFRLGPLTNVVSVMEARSLTSPELTARVAAAVLLSFAYLPFKDAFISSEEPTRGRLMKMSMVMFCLFAA